MRYTDVAIVGGGLAGSTAAAMLGRAGIAAVLIDPHTVYPPELRCEKLGGEQLDLLRKTGLADATLRATTLDGEVWEARFGYVVARKPSDQHGVMYDTLVNTVRGQIPPDVETIHAKASAVANGPERQKLVLSNGEEISARLVVLRQRPECRPASDARHQAPRRQRMPFGHARLRPRTGRPRGLRFPGTDLLAEAIELAHGLSLDFSDRRGDARQSDGLSRHDRPLAAGVPAGARAGDARA